MFKIIMTIFLLLISYTSLYGVVVADYRMDQCYWLDNAGGIIDDVSETNNSLDGTSHGFAKTYLGTPLNTAPVCMAGDFNATGDFVDVPNNILLNTTNTFSASAWIRPNAQSYIPGFGRYQVFLSKTTTYGNGFSLYTYWNGATAYIIFLIGNGVVNTMAWTTFVPNNTWMHVVGTYDGINMRLYVNGVQAGITAYVGGILNANTFLTIGQGTVGTYQYSGAIDEVKVYNHTLTPIEVNATYINELAGKNYDGTLRVCPTCDANVTAGIWSFVGIPADLRRTPTKNIANIFDEFNATSYDVPTNTDGWVVLKRDYNATNNDSNYSVVPYTGFNVPFGQGYWLISKVSKTWSTNALANVDYNSTNPACVGTRCVEIDLTPVNLNFGAPAFDPNDGSGKNRNNMLGFVGDKPVNWADCRIVITDANGTTTAYTPTDANLSGFADSQVWQYNPGAVGANANGYTTCSDISPGGCKLEPYKGFWVILHGITKGKTVQLLVPKE